MMRDVNGAEIVAGELMALLCTVSEIREEGVIVRVLNSQMELLVSCERDEVLGSIAGSELQRVAAASA